jgi:PAP2 superfamily
VRAAPAVPLLAFVVYIAVMTVLMIALGVSINPDRYFFVLLGPVLLIRRGRRFVLDWLPFLLLLFSYEFLRGLAEQLGNVHYDTAIRVDTALFAMPPSVALQQRFFHPRALAWYDYLAALLYMMHFVVPLSFAYLLWLRSRQQFARFTGAFLLLSYAALTTFVLFPAAPPWLASQHGYLPTVYEGMSMVLAAFPDRLHLPTVYQLFDPNQVAAVPSLHAAYPFLILLFAWRIFRARALLLAPYVAGVWLAIVYMGEHYVFDIAVGALYSLAAFVVVEHLVPGLLPGARAEPRPAAQSARRAA